MRRIHGDKVPRKAQLSDFGQGQLSGTASGPIEALDRFGDGIVKEAKDAIGAKLDERPCQYGRKAHSPPIPQLPIDELILDEA